MKAPATAGPVPERYRGVWQRTLLQTPTLRDTTTTVFWLQTAHWHADIRIPASRPNFIGVAALADCSAGQRAWLATQQGFAGVTAVTATPSAEICTWHRLLDFQPPAAGPDAGYMQFTPTHLIETGVHGVYLEHWQKLPGSDDGFMVLQCLQDDANVPVAPRLLLVAGDHVMHLRARTQDWPADTLPGTALGLVADLQAMPALLDFEIDFGRRTVDGWEISQSTLPWREGTRIAVRMTPPGVEMPRDAQARWQPQTGEAVDLSWNGASSRWQVLEWRPPAPSAPA